MRRAVLLLLIVACAHGGAAEKPPAAPATPKEVVDAGRATIEQWRQAYEVRSMDALGKLYVHDPQVVVVLEGMPLIGWSSVEAMLRDRLARAKEIHVRLKDVSVTSYAPTLAGVLATMTREIGDGVTTVTEQGTLTVLLRRVDDGSWKIVVEHYSYKR